MILESLLKIKEINPFLYNIRYINGIPNKNESCLLKLDISKESLFFKNAEKNDLLFFELNKKQIKNILIEDQTTIENRVGFKRMLLVGIFAFAWKKREVNPLSFFIIEYSDDLGLDQEIYIQSDNKDGFQNFTNLKYNIFKFWKDSENISDIDTAIFSTQQKIKFDESEKNKNSLKGCLFLLVFVVVIIFIVYLIFN